MATGGTRALPTGIGGYLALAVATAPLMVLVATALDTGPPDLRVYNDALSHVRTDDVYVQRYPELPFTYPPSSLLLLAPLGIPRHLTALLLLGATVVAVWVTVRLVVGVSAPVDSPFRRGGGMALLTAVALLSWPVVYGVGLGQIAPLLMGISTFATLGAVGLSRGIWLGAATAVKLTPAVFALHWWLLGWRRSVTVAVGTFVGLTAIAWVVMPQSSGWYYLAGGVIRADVELRNATNQSLAGVVLRLGWDSPGSAWAVRGISLALLAVGLLVAGRVHRAGWTAMATCLVGLWSGIAAPIGWVHAFCWWAPLAFAIGLAGTRPSDRLVAGLCLLLPYSLLLIDPIGPTSGLGGQALGALSLIGTLAMTLWLALRVRMALGEAVLRCPRAVGPQLP